MEGKTMMERTGNKAGAVLSFLLGLLLVMGITTAMAGEDSSESGQQPPGKAFTSPEEAAKALLDACKRNDKQALITIFGPEGEEIISSGDEVADQTQRAAFVKYYEEKHHLEEKIPGTSILCAGEEDWPLPVPIVKKGEKWYFDAAAGKEEILNRRIGRNELSVIDVVHAYVDAQREYESEDRDDDGVQEFAQKVMSDEGKKDGLFWPAKEGEESSPLGPFAAEAVKEGYRKKEGGPTPYHGYYYKILTKQGKSAPGGEYDYVVNGNMILGYALIAYPADYGNSGIMTFIVNQDDIVYEKDLGPDTGKMAGSMEAYDPDETWEKSEATGESAS